MQLEDSEELSKCQSAALAALAVIGGVDAHPRLGGLVRHEEYGQGTVAHIMPNGKVTVQFHVNQSKDCDANHSVPHGNQQARIVRLSELTSVSHLRRFWL